MTRNPVGTRDEWLVARPELLGRPSRPDHRDQIGRTRSPPLTDRHHEVARRTEQPPLHDDTGDAS